MKYRITATLAGLVVGICLVSGETRSGTTSYDMSSLLFEQHPFATNAPLRPVVAVPLPPAQIRAPARMPQSAIPSRAGSRPAAQRSASERRPPVIPQSVAAAPPPRARGNGPSGIVSEIRIGALVHDQGPFSSNEEDGFDGNLEFLFVSPDFLDIIWAPRPHFGFTVNSTGDTSQAYMGLSWEWSFWRNWFAGFSLGGSVHDGKRATNRIDRKELGCRILFRESIEVGYRFDGHHGISGFLDHISNANLCDNNEGLENFGIRYGYLF